MSRYNLTPENSSDSVAVGWDNPLEVFFFQVLDCHDEEVVNREVPSLLQLIQAAEHNGYSIPDNILRSLRNDYANRNEPTPLQLKMRAMFS